MKKTLAVTLAVLSGLPAFAAEVIRGDITSKVPINHTPSYFYKPTPDGRYVGFSSEEESGNFLFDLHTRTYYPIPGSYDPVFAQNTRLLATPIDGYKFYRLEDLMRDNRNAVPIYHDTTVPGVYESIGILSKSTNEVSFRMISESGSDHYMRDYKEHISRRGQTIKVEPISPRKDLCPSFDFKLPMLSKDGRELGGLHLNASTAFEDDSSDTGTSTKIFSIADNGTCTIADDLGVKTGKISFSYDKRYITYHQFKTAGEDYSNYYINVPDADFTSDIYVYDRHTGEHYQLTSNTNSNSMYPEFLLNGSVIFVDYPNNKREKVTFYVVNDFK